MADDLTLSESRYSHVINVPIEKVDIADWLLHLSEAEYQRCCPPDHLGFGLSKSDDGRQMSINVETIGESLMIQHYYGEVLDKHLCRMVSKSDVITARGRSKVHVLWELSVKAVDATHSEYSNYVLGSATEEFVAFAKEHGLTIAEARAARQAASGDHNRRETPLFAESIERRALAKG